MLDANSNAKNDQELRAGYDPRFWTGWKRAEGESEDDGLSSPTLHSPGEDVQLVGV